MGKAIANAIIEYKKGILSGDRSERNSEETIPDIAVVEEKKMVTEEINKTEEAKEVPPVKETVVQEIKGEKEQKEVVKENTSTPKELETKPITTPKSAITFKVQILASAKKIPLRAENFNGLNKLSKEPYKNLFRYMYGSTESYNQAKLFKSNADVKGYTSSYIVAYKDGERIAIKEALKYLSD